MIKQTSSNLYLVLTTKLIYLKLSLVF